MSIPETLADWFRQFITQVQSRVSEAIEFLLKHRDLITVIVGLVTILGSLVKLIKWYIDKRRREREELEKFLSRLSLWLRGEDLVKLNERAKDILRVIVRGWDERYVKVESVEEWHEQIKEGLTKSGKVLVFGKSGLGKTRACIEVLREFIRNNRRWRKAYIVFVSKNRRVNEVSPPRNIGRIVLFFDDLNRYLEVVDVPELIQRVSSKAEEVLVVSTCRSEYGDEVKRRWGHVFDIRELKEITYEEGEIIAKELGESMPLKNEFDGTIGEITLGTLGKREIYDEMRGDSRMIPHVRALRAVKLLNRAWVFTPKLRHVELVWREIFGDGGDWYTVIEELKTRGFIEVRTIDKADLVYIPDPYLDRVIHDYPPGGGTLFEDLERLINLLVEEKAFEEIFMTGVAFALDPKLKDYKKSIECFSKTLRVKPDLAEAYYNRGYSYFELGMLEEALIDFEICWLLRSLLPDKGARIPLTVLLILRGREEYKEIFWTWFDRALEVYELLDPTSRRFVEELSYQV